MNGQSCSFNCPKGQFKDSADFVCSACFLNCETCGDSSTCLKCLLGTYMLEDSCLEVCPAGFYPDTQIQRCKVCDAGCKSCFALGEEACTSCNSPTLLAGYKCYTDCPIGYRQLDLETCTPCNEKCARCFGPSDKECDSCLS